MQKFPFSHPVGETVQADRVDKRRTLGIVPGCGFWLAHCLEKCELYVVICESNSLSHPICFLRVQLPLDFVYHLGISLFTIKPQSFLLCT